MSPSIVLALVWLLVANVGAMMPSRDMHWRFAYVLIALGVPVLAYVVWENGIWIGLLVLAAAASVLRWPVMYLGRWLRQKTGL